MYFLRKFLAFSTLALLILVAVTAPSAYAETTSGSASAASSAKLEARQPSLSVQDVVVDKASYSAGEVIRGTFTITNHSDFAVSGISYKAYIASGYKEPAPGVKFSSYFIDSSELKGEFSLDKGGSQAIDFSYQIPAFIDGAKLGLQIRLLSDTGLSLGLGDSSYISIKKQVAGVLIKDMSLLLSDGNKYGLTEGPTIYKDKEPKGASLLLTITNTENKSVTIDPKLFVYNQKSPGVKTPIAIDDLVLKAKEVRKVTLPLPSPVEAGVYDAELLLLDPNGLQMAARITARYIIAGNVSSVHAVTLSRTSVLKGEKFHFASSISGRPFDISLLKSDNQAKVKGTFSQVGKVDILVKNESGATVASVSKPFKVYGDNFLSEDLVASEAALSFSVEMSIYDETGKLLQSYTKDFKPDSKSQIVEETPENDSWMAFDYMPYVPLALGLVLALIIMVLIVKRMIPRGPGAAMMFLVLFAATYPTATHIVNAYVLTGSSSTGCVGQSAPTVTVYGPYDYQTYNDGEAFYLSGHLQYAGCGNSLQTVTMQASSNMAGESYSQTLVQQWIGGIDHSGAQNYGTDFVFGPFTAKAISGAAIYFAAQETNGCINDSVSGYVPLTVKLDVCPNIAGFQETVPAGKQLKAGKCVDTPKNYNNRNGSGLSCSSGTYFCDVSETCIANSLSCDDMSNPPIFKINQNIPASIGPGKLKTKILTGKPAITNRGGSCVINWANAFATYDDFTTCTFTGGVTPIDFAPGSESAPTSATISNLQKDTAVKLICRESDGYGEEVSAEGVCRINWDYKEIN